MEEHYFYVLYSLKDNKLYKGYSSDFPSRFLRHAAGGTKSTKHRRPLVLIHIEIFPTKKEAMDRERYAKTTEGGKELRNLLITKNILDMDGILNIERLKEVVILRYLTGLYIIKTPTSDVGWEFI